MRRMDKSAIIHTLQEQGGFITTGEVKSRGEYKQPRRAAEAGTVIRLRKGIYAVSLAFRFKSFLFHSILV